MHIESTVLWGERWLDVRLQFRVRCHEMVTGRVL